MRYNRSERTYRCRGSFGAACPGRGAFRGRTSAFPCGSAVFALLFALCFFALLPGRAEGSVIRRDIDAVMTEMAGVIPGPGPASGGTVLLLPAPRGLWYTPGDLSAEEAEEAEEAGLTVTVLLTGEDTGTEFTCLVEMFLDGRPLGGSYPLSGAAEGTIASGGELRLRGGRSVTVGGLPVGTAFRVIQIKNGLYRTRVSVNGGSEETAQEISGTVDSIYGSTVVFRNVRTTVDITVTNRWNGPDRGRIKLYVFSGIKAEVLAHGVMQMQLMDPQPKVERNGNTYTLSGLPREDGWGREMVYALQEYDIPEDHYVSYLNLGEYRNFYTYAFDDGEIINTYEGPQYVSINVYKRFTGVGEGEKLPDTTLDVYRINPDRTSLLVKTLTLSAENIRGRGGRISIGGLLEGYYYYVLERPRAGYTLRYTDPSGRDADRAYAEGEILAHKIPRTGDDRPVVLWSCASAVSSCGIVLLLLRKKRRSRGDG